MWHSKSFVDNYKFIVSGELAYLYQKILLHTQKPALGEPQEQEGESRSEGRRRELLKSEPFMIGPLRHWLWVAAYVRWPISMECKASHVNSLPLPGWQLLSCCPILFIVIWLRKAQRMGCGGVFLPAMLLLKITAAILKVESKKWQTATDKRNAPPCLIWSPVCLQTRQDTDNLESATSCCPRISCPVYYVDEAKKTTVLKP